MVSESNVPKPTPPIITNEWYTSEGWQLFNELLTELEQTRCTIVWVENFEIIRNALMRVSKKDLISLFDKDTQNWVMRMDQDGVLFAVKK